MLPGNQEAPNDVPPRTILVRGRALDYYAQAVWAPRYRDQGWDAFDPRTLPEWEPLRDAALRAAERPNLTPELAGVRGAYEYAVAMPAAWLTAVPDFDAPLSEQHAAWVLEGMGEEMHRLHQALLPAAERYCGQRCVATASYGPRLYTDGCVLIGHLDAYPEHVFSISVTLDGSAWGMQMRDLSIATNGDQWEVGTEPGTAVIYEGCRMLHARMEPTRANYLAAFFHFRPAEFACGHGEPEATASGVQYLPR